jgi:hypothetical protein
VAALAAPCEALAAFQCCLLAGLRHAGLRATLKSTVLIPHGIPSVVMGTHQVNSTGVHFKLKWLGGLHETLSQSSQSLAGSA